VPAVVPAAVPDAVPDAVIVHSPDHVRAVLAAAEGLGLDRLTLASAPGAAAYAGPIWFHEMVAHVCEASVCEASVCEASVCEASGSEAEPRVKVTAILDCADRPGDALAALRAGVRDISLGGSSSSGARRSVSAIARKLNARVHTYPGSNALDLLGTQDPVAVCDTWLAKSQRSHTR
jgi:hypothetical protein